MKNRKLLGLFGVLQAVIFSLFFTSSIVVAEMPPQPKPLWSQEKATSSDGKVVKDERRDPSTYCVNCHRFSKFEHAGKHFQKDTLSPNTSKPLNCVSCHGNISEQHRKGVKDVMRFSGFRGGKNPALKRTVQEQNQVCFACHNPVKLREAFWPHDVHANKMACANCHKLHPAKEPMVGIEHKNQVKLCVDCHSRIHQGRAKKLEKAKDK